MDVRKLFETIRDIPYRIPIGPERDDCCIGKHARLFRALKEVGFDVRYRVCRYRWSDLPIDHAILKLNPRDESTHVFLEIMQGDIWIPIDATWDRELSSTFEVNEWGKSMKIAVTPVEVFSPKESARYMSAMLSSEIEIDQGPQMAFFQALNNWLAKVRQN